MPHNNPVGHRYGTFYALTAPPDVKGVILWPTVRPYQHSHLPVPIPWGRAINSV